MMSKILLLISIILLILPTLVSTQEIKIGSEQMLNQNEPNISADFTHNIFAEYATTTWCPSCPFAAEALYEIYESQEYPFSYVTFVSDVNPNAQERTRDYYTVVIPTVYFDGGNTLFVGNAGSVSATKLRYIQHIEENGYRTTKSSIQIESSAVWVDNAKIDIQVIVSNQGNSFYFGKIRTYVSEIESRWLDYDGIPYHNAFLNYAFNEILFLMPGSSKTFTTTWDGNTNHNGLTFGDILEDNIIINSAVFHWIPHLRTGYEGSQYTQQYLSFFVDQSDVITLL
jgi:thiol-disulfide isomerase/thioredoxin